MEVHMHSVKALRVKQANIKVKNIMATQKGSS